MNNPINITSHEVKISKSGLPTLIINNIHLHSAYNPLKESENFLKQYKDIINNNSNILILGLGLGYHIQKIANYFKENLKIPYQINVIEPLQETVQICQQYNPINDPSIKIFYKENPADLYLDVDIINFLEKKPSVIIYRPSYNIFKNYFKNFLTYENNNDLVTNIDFIKSQELKDYLKQYNPDERIHKIIDEITNKKTLNNPWEFFLMAFDQVN